jgi:RimJ/RimL family protein N-acetyltransferase
LNQKIVIHTPRLNIVSFDKKHLTPEYVGWLNDKAIVAFSEQRHSSHSMESVKGFCNSFKNSPNHFLAMEKTGASAGHIGNMSVIIDSPNAVADIRILIGDLSSWSKGYGSEAWIGVCDFFLRIKNIRKITAGTLSVNKGMQRIVEKAGMKPDGIRKKQNLWNGEEVDMMYFSLFKKEWLSIYPESLFKNK